MCRKRVEKLFICDILIIKKENIETKKELKQNLYRQSFRVSHKFSGNAMPVVFTGIFS